MLICLIYTDENIGLNIVLTHNYKGAFLGPGHQVCSFSKKISMTLETLKPWPG